MNTGLLFGAFLLRTYMRTSNTRIKLTRCIAWTMFLRILNKNMCASLSSIGRVVRLRCVRVLFSIYSFWTRVRWYKQYRLGSARLCKQCTHDDSVCVCLCVHDNLYSLQSVYVHEIKKKHQLNRQRNTRKKRDCLYSDEFLCGTVWLSHRYHRTKPLFTVVFLSMMHMNRLEQQACELNFT